MNGREEHPDKGLRFAGAGLPRGTGGAIVDDVDEHLCENCGGVLPRTGTYCLACDTPVANAERGLSVGDTQVVQHGRPLVGAAVMAACLLAVVGVGFTIHRLWESHLDGNAEAAAVRGTQVLVHAENGDQGAKTACTHAETAVIGDPTTVREECAALLGSDPGATVRGLHAASVRRSGQHATVDLRGTWVDAHGRAPYSRTVRVRSDHNEWELVWDGTALAAG